MSLKLRAVENVSATWFSLLIHALVSLFLSPLVLHKLGDAGFSVWVLVFSLTGYFGLLDLGVRSSIVRFVAHGTTQTNHQELQRLLATSLGFYSLVAILVLLLTGIGWYHVHSLFKLPLSLFPTARVLFLLVGVSVALTFPLSVFAGALEGLQEFARVQLTQTGITVLRGLGVAVGLVQGKGLITIGLMTVGANLAGQIVLMRMAHHRLPFSLCVRHIDPRALRKMLQHGAFAFIIVLAEKLRFHSDVVVIGSLLSSSAITIYAIAARLAEYSTYAVRSMAQIFTPMASQFHAEGGQRQLKRVVIAGNRACALILFPILTTLIVLGRSIIQVWVGPKYVGAYSILILLIVPRGLYLAQSASIRVLLGTGRHSVLAWVLLAEGVVNVFLSVILLPHFGLLGVALGTSIPLAFTSVIVLPWHVSRRLGVSVKTLFKTICPLPIGFCLPQAAALWYLADAFPAHNYRLLLGEIACGGLLYTATVLFKLLCVAPRDAFRLRGVKQLLEPQFDPH